MPIVLATAVAAGGWVFALWLALLLIGAAALGVAGWLSRRSWRQQARKLRESEALTRSIVESTVDGIITADENGVICSFNPAAERMFGYQAGEIIGQNLKVLIPPPHRERHDGYRRSYLESGIERMIGGVREVQAVRKNGSTFPVELAVCQMRLPGRRMFTGILHDITGRKQAEEALREVNEELEAIIETSPLPVFTLDLEGRVRSWNPAAERVFGWTAREVIGRPLPYIPEDEWAGFLATLQVVHSAALLPPLDRRRRRRDGKSIELSIWRAPLTDPEGGVNGVLAIAADVSERKELEEQFRQAQKMEAIGRLAGGVAHDFNNILTVITGYGQMILEREEIDAGLAQQATEIMKACEHAGALTTRLLVFSRHQVLNPQPLNLGMVVARLENMLRRLIGEDVVLSTIIEPGLADVKADAAQIEQVIMNLAVNARDAMPSGGRLVIEASNVRLDPDYTRTHIGVKEGAYVMLAISDTGRGIPPEIRSRLFEPFFTTKERGKGTGLGLSTVYGIVKQSGGEIWVYSEVDKGTTFKIYLPQAVEIPSEAVAVEETPPAGRGAGTVLLVEDEAGVRRLVCQILRQHGYEVLEAEDVHEALRLCQEHREQIDLLLTDVVMPVMSGRELADRLAQLRPDLKVLYMSGYTDNIVLYHGVRAGERPFIQKPFTPRSLVRKVREVLDT